MEAQEVVSILNLYVSPIVFNHRTKNQRAAGSKKIDDVGEGFVILIKRAAGRFKAVNADDHIEDSRRLIVVGDDAALVNICMQQATCPHHVARFVFDAIDGCDVGAFALVSADIFMSIKQQTKFA